jgi:hypothetical protein
VLWIVGPQVKINVGLFGSGSTKLIYLVFTMESYLNPVCGVKTEITEPHGEPPSRGMDHSVHTLLVIKIILANCKQILHL